MSGWTFEQWIAFITVMAAPISGIIVAFIANRRSKAPEQVTQPMTRADGSARGDTVSEHQAHVAEISVIIDGFTASHRALTEDFERVRRESSECRDRTDALEARFRASERARIIERQMMVDHIEILEALIPVPPGAPARPVWGD